MLFHNIPYHSIIFHVIPYYSVWFHKIPYDSISFIWTLPFHRLLPQGFQWSLCEKQTHPNDLRIFGGTSFSGERHSEGFFNHDFGFHHIFVNGICHQLQYKGLAVVAEETVPLNVKGVGPSLKVDSAFEALVVASQADPSSLLKGSNIRRLIGK